MTTEKRICIDCEHVWTLPADPNNPFANVHARCPQCGSQNTANIDLWNLAQDLENRERGIDTKTGEGAL